MNEEQDQKEDERGRANATARVLARLRPSRVRGNAVGLDELHDDEDDDENDQGDDELEVGVAGDENENADDGLRVGVDVHDEDGVARHQRAPDKRRIKPRVRYSPPD